CYYDYDYHFTCGHEEKKMKDNATLEEQCPMHPSVPCLLKTTK
ncbi:hypothetical protein MRX96_052321, partial [Rhipicephalus microplus]